MTRKKKKMFVLKIDSMNDLDTIKMKSKRNKKSINNTDRYNFSVKILIA